MLLRSSSTPILGSLISSVLESPNNNHYHHHHHHAAETNAPIKSHHHHLLPSHAKLSIHQPATLNPISCNSSPISPSLVDSHKGFRRVQSEGNLAGLAAFASYNDNSQDSSNANYSNKPSKKPTKVLQTIPSFSFYGSRGGREEEHDEMMSDIEDGDEYGDDRSEKGHDKVMAVESIDFGSENKMMMNTAHEKPIGIGPWNLGFAEKKEVVAEQMYLAKGLGIGVCGSGSGGNGFRDFNLTDYGGNGGDGDKQDIEEHYKKMMEENPGDPLFMRNYAQFLYRTKRDLQGAETYYSRAILLDPTDGEVLSQYAQLVWELNHDQHRALSYFERAVQASPENSHVQAAYANFLWETEEDDDDDECDLVQDFGVAPPYLHKGAFTSVAG